MVSCFLIGEYYLDDNKTNITIPATISSTNVKVTGKAIAINSHHLFVMNQWEVLMIINRK